jgi:hypothetical protein
LGAESIAFSSSRAARTAIDECRLELECVELGRLAWLRDRSIGGAPGLGPCDIGRGRTGLEGPW